MKRTTLYILLLLCRHPGTAQEFPTIRFSHLTTKEGLSNNYVTWISEDRKGFIWIGTRDGLNRLDGYRIKTFYHQPSDTNTLVANYISQLQTDAKNNLWIGTYGGISQYDRLRNTFTNFKHKEGDPHSLSADWCQAMYFDTASNQLWACVQRAIYCFDQDQRYQRIEIDTTWLPSFESNAITYFKLYEDTQRRLWAACGNFLLRIDRRSKKIVQTFQTAGPFVRCIFQLSPDIYWLGTFSGGVLQLNTTTSAIQQVNLPPDVNHVDNICKWRDKDNHQWIVIGSNLGLILVDPTSLKYKILTPDDKDGKAISPGEIICVFVDRSGILWVGTESGINYVEPSKQLIESWAINPAAPEKKQSRAINFAYSFYQLPDGYLAGHWAETGLFQYDRRGNLTGVINNLHLNLPRWTNVFAIHRLNNGHLLLSTDTSITEYSLDQHRCIAETADPAIPIASFRTISQYDDSTWYIRTRNNSTAGIYVYNSNQHKFTAHYYAKPNCGDCLPPKIHALLITRNKTVYAAPERKYLYVLDKANDKFVPFFLPKGTALPNTFDCLTEGPDGNIWIGTPNGLFEINPATKQVVADYTTHAAIGGLEIEAICFDDRGTCWMNTERGMFALDPTTGQVVNFNTGDGLPANSLPGFLSKGTDGFIYSGAFDHIVRFDPQKLLHQHFTGAIQLSNVTVMEKTQPIATNGPDKSITLQPGQNVFAIDYSILNYDNPSGNRYYYRIDGIMKDWRENENGHLQFNNISPGDYTLHMKGSDKYGNPFPGQDSLVIHILPYWWQAQWFYALLLSLFALAAALWVRKRIRTIRRESDFRTRLAETELMALRTQMNPHFIFNCMNIIDGFIVSNRREDAQQFLQKFSKLIRLVLENSQHQQVLVQQDLQALQLYIELEAIRFNHHFKYEFDIGEDLIDENRRIPPLILQPYVENAIVHGLRNKEDGEGRLVIRLKSAGDNIVAEIEDNGIGRTKAALLQKENQMNHQHLGMKMTAKRIQLLRQLNTDKVDIRISDLSPTPDPGTKVTIIL